jgi:hypothetical protein
MRTITIGVGYGWSDGPVHRDARWQELRGFCSMSAEQGRKMAAAILSRGVSVEDQECETDSPDWTLPRVSVARLRGSIGQFTWDSVRQHIDDSDIVVFDVTPNKTDERNCRYVSDNIWIEIGYALADHQRPVFLVHSQEDGHKILPSDLRGLMIGHLPSKSKKKYDASLRMGLALAVRRLAVERAEEAANSDDIRAVSRGIPPVPKRPSTKKLPKK